MTETTLRRIKADAYGVGVLPPPPVAHFYALSLRDGELVASVYSDAGVWMLDRGSISSDAPVTPSACILDAPDDLVGDGSFAWKSAPGELTVWDVEHDTTFTYACEEGLEVTPPFYLEGFVYWCEYTHTNPGGVDGVVTLRRAACDLDEPSTLQTAEVYPWIDFFIPDHPMSVAAVAMTREPAFVLILIGAGEAEGYQILRIGTSADPFDVVEVGSWASQSFDGVALGFPDPAGTSAGGARVGDTTVRVLRGISNELPPVVADRWPTTGEWDLIDEAGEDTPALYNAALSGDAATALLYANTGSASVVIEAPTAVGGSLPSRRAVIQPDTDGFTPHALFFMT